VCPSTTTCTAPGSRSCANAALVDALAAAPAITIARSHGGAIAVDLALHHPDRVLGLRHPDRVRALVLLEGDVLSLSETAAREVPALEERVLAAAQVDVGTVAERLLRDVLGDRGWEGLPEPARDLFTANSPAIVAEFRGGFPDVTAAQLATIGRPTLLLAGKDSALDYAETTELMAAAMPAARRERVEGGHAIDPAHPAVLGFVDEVLGG
jgi:pimeloyl-ACP methyl ester carboxylesterase